MCKHGMQKYRCKICGKTLERMVEQYDHLMDSHMALISRMASIEDQHAAHQAFIAALTELFNDHKDAHGCAGRTLEVL